MIVVSDLGGTITRGYPVIGLVKWVRHNQSAFRANYYLARHILDYLFSKLGWVDNQKLGQRMMFTSLPLIKNPSHETLEHMAEWSVERELWPRRRQDVVDRLTAHVDDGAQVYIASSIYEPTVLAFAKRIGVHGIGTPLEIVNGHVRFAEALVAEDQKAEKVMTQLGVDKVDVAYGDTWADIPLLEHAVRPVAVYPDEALKARALERGWEVHGDRKAK
jgi:phosphoserine phosphatase